MSISIKTDLTSSILEEVQGKLLSAAQKLSSAKSINSAADGAAQLSLSQSIGTDVRAANTSISNSQMEKAMMNVADSDLSQISDNNQKMRDLAVQSANGVYGNDERAAIQDEINQLQEENTRIAKNSTFNDKKLLDGSAQGTQVMASESAPVTVDNAFKSATPEDLGIDNTDVSTQENAMTLVNKIDQAQTEINQRRTELSTTSSALDNNIDKNKVTVENLTAANSTISDTDVAQEMVNMIQAKIQMQATIAVQSQANAANKTVMNLLRTSAS